MYYRLLSLLLLLPALTPADAATSPKDSLRTALIRTADPNEQIRIYRDLADITADTPEACGYLLALTEKARTEGRVEPMMEALTDLTVNYLRAEKTDSAYHYSALVREYAPADEYDRWGSYVEMRIFLSELKSGNINQAIEAKIEKIKTKLLDKKKIYQQIEAEFIIGLSLDNKGQYEDAIPYLNKSLELTKELSFRKGAPYQLLILHQLARMYNITEQTQQASKILTNAIQIKEQYYEAYDKQERPFYPMDDFYITHYSGLLINIEHMTEQEVQFYLNRLIEMSDRSSNPAHKYSRFLAQFNHSSRQRNLRQALIYNDSLIHYARKCAVYSLPDLYRINALIYENIGEYQLALANQREFSRLQDSISHNDRQEQLDKMRVEHDVNRLNYEKSQLEIRNKHILLVCLSVILLSALMLCFYLYIHLTREREMKERMHALKMRAEESENLKTAFINSICHEIRTPLNSIVGFSALLLDPAIDEQERSTFPAEIQHNTDQLVGLIDSMLEVSDLNVSDEKLPCTQIDLTGLCRTIMARYGAEPEHLKLQSRTEVPAQVLLIQTNERYLTLVIDNLLHNAYKFTEQGTVTLQCVGYDDHVQISVADTGCGIPPEKHQMIFDRFTKLDTYKRGNGLGLYLCKEIVRRLSGKIYVDPDYKAGTRIVVELPLE